MWVFLVPYPPHIWHTKLIMDCRDTGHREWHSNTHYIFTLQDGEGIVSHSQTLLFAERVWLKIAWQKIETNEQALGLCEIGRELKVEWVQEREVKMVCHWRSIPGLPSRRGRLFAHCRFLGWSRWLPGSAWGWLGCRCLHLWLWQRGGNPRRGALPPWRGTWLAVQNARAAWLIPSLS